MAQILDAALRGEPRRRRHSAPPAGQPAYPEHHAPITRTCACPTSNSGEAFRVRRAQRQKNIYRTMARARAGFFLQGATRPLIPGYLLRDFRLVLSATIPGNLDDLTHLDELILLREAMRTTLKAAGFPQSRLGRLRPHQLGLKPSQPAARLCTPAPTLTTTKGASSPSRSSTATRSSASPRRGLISPSPRVRTNSKCGSYQSRTSRRALACGTWAR